MKTKRSEFTRVHHTRPKKNALPTGGHRRVMQHNSLVMYDGRCAMYDGNFSALRAFLRSESKTKFSRMRAMAPMYDARFTIYDCGIRRVARGHGEV